MPSDDGYEYRAGMSESGLLVEIDVILYGRPVGFIQVPRSEWPRIVRDVSSAMTAQRVVAEVGNILEPDDGE